MIKLQISDYLSKLDDDDLHHISETQSLIIRANPDAKLFLWDYSKGILIEKLNRIMAYAKIMEQVRTILKS